LLKVTSDGDELSSVAQIGESSWSTFFEEVTASTEHKEQMVWQSRDHNTSVTPSWDIMGTSVQVSPFVLLSIVDEEVLELGSGIPSTVDEDFL
jgi:hypothetical protein